MCCENENTDNLRLINFTRHLEEFTMNTYSLNYITKKNIISNKANIVVLSLYNRSIRLRCCSLNLPQCAKRYICLL